MHRRRKLRVKADDSGPRGERRALQYARRRVIRSSGATPAVKKKSYTLVLPDRVALTAQGEGTNEARRWRQRSRTSSVSLRNAPVVRPSAFVAKAYA